MSLVSRVPIRAEQQRRQARKPSSPRSLPDRLCSLRHPSNSESRTVPLPGPRLPARAASRLRARPRGRAGNTGHPRRHTAPVPLRSAASRGASGPRVTVAQTHRVRSPGARGMHRARRGEPRREISGTRREPNTWRRSTPWSGRDSPVRRATARLRRPSPPFPLLPSVRTERADRVAPPHAGPFKPWAPTRRLRPANEIETQSPARSAPMAGGSAQPVSGGPAATSYGGRTPGRGSPASGD
jgi:hypothetical protein